MSAVVKATRKPIVFTRRESDGQRAKRMFREFASNLGRPQTPRWEQTSPAVREFWMQSAKMVDQ